MVETDRQCFDLGEVFACLFSLFYVFIYLFLYLELAKKTLKHWAKHPAVLTLRQNLCSSDCPGTSCLSLLSAGLQPCLQCGEGSIIQTALDQARGSSSSHSEVTCVGPGTLGLVGA